MREGEAVFRLDSVRQSHGVVKKIRKLHK